MISQTTRLLLLIAFPALVSGCMKRSISGDSVAALEADSILMLFQSTTDSVNMAWNRMIRDDDEKLFHIKRLLEEVTYTGNYDRLALDSLLTKQNYLVELRYDQKTMSDSDLIDEYDALTSQLIFEVTSLAKQHPDYNKYPLMEELIMDIMEADNKVLLHRIRYDNFCRDYNSLVESSESLLSAAGENNLQPIPLFTLSE